MSWRGWGDRYPWEFWLLFGGTLVSAIGGSMVWPFLTLYLRQRFPISLTLIASLLTLNAVAGLATTAVAGLVVDRFGRKGAMVAGLVGSGLVLLGMIPATSLLAWAALMAFMGGFGPIYRVGSDAMVADLIEPSRRASAYALLRMMANLGVAIGPAIGGFVVSASYGLAFALGGAAQLFFAWLVLLGARETRPQTPNEPRASPLGGGYAGILRDRPFLAFCGFYTLAGMAYITMMVLLPVYVKEGFGVPEHLYGFIMTTNAAMVVGLQYGITRLASRFRELWVLSAGALFYALGVGSVALGRSFPAFLFSMALLTIGEMLMIPTATTLTANMAPPEARGRYMSIYGLTWGVGFGVGPVIGGILHDRLGPVAIWWGGAGIALVAALGFLGLARRLPAMAPRLEIEID
ncbi:MDR family MFS transporter [Thermoflexus sp.]|uniref:MDR family MFS transporter n=1 Tax=Thermoflexus sp. TaxID=1969742 RepID=UPI0035E44DDC